MTSEKKQEKSLSDKALDALDEYPLAFKVEIDPDNKTQATMLYASIAIIIILVIILTFLYSDFYLSLWLSIIGTIILNAAIYMH